MYISVKQIKISESIVSKVYQPIGYILIIIAMMKLKREINVKKVNKTKGRKWTFPLVIEHQNLDTTNKKRFISYAFISEIKINFVLKNEDRQHQCNKEGKKEEKGKKS